MIYMLKFSLLFLLFYTFINCCNYPQFDFYEIDLK